MEKITLNGKTYIEEEVEVITPKDTLYTEREFQIGKDYFIRTVTFVFVGKVIKENKRFVSLTSCSLIADTGRFNKAMEKGIETESNAEIEVYPSNTVVNIGIGTIIDFCEYSHELPTETK